MDKYCCNCGGNSCGYDRVVREESNETYKTKEEYDLIWQVFVNLQLNRRQTERKVIDVLSQYCCITLQDSDGVGIILDEFEDALPDDESCRWYERFLEADSSGNFPKRYYNAARYKDRYIPTLRMLDIAAKLIVMND